jgi:Tol biopolymer transport system component
MSESSNRRCRRARLSLVVATVLVGGSLVAAGCGRSADPWRPSDGLVFVRSTGEGGTDVFRARLSDGAVQVVAATPGVIEAEPLWLSASRQLLTGEWPVGEPEVRPRLMLRDLQTGRIGRATERNLDREVQAAVSPDGKRVVYVFLAAPNSMPQSGMKILNPMSAVDEMLSGQPRGHIFVAPRFSPDRSSVAVQVQGRRRGDDLYVLSIKGPRGPVTDNEALVDAAPRFARDGKSLFFSRSAFQKPRPGAKRAADEAKDGAKMGGGDICQVQLPSNQVRCIDASDDAREFDVDPSPTRDEVVFVREQGGATGEIDIFRVDVSGDNLQRLTEDPSRSERNPRWSPDGERIVFEVGSGPEGQIVVIDRAGRQIFETQGSSPSWAPPFADTE